MVCQRVDCSISFSLICRELPIQRVRFLASVSTPNRQVADAERRETLFGVEAHGDPFREVGAQQRGYFRGVLLRHDDHAQFGTRFARDFLQAFERGFARGIRRMEKFDVGRRGRFGLAVVEPRLDFEFGNAFAEGDVLGRGSRGCETRGQQPYKQHFLHKRALFYSIKITIIWHMDQFFRIKL